MHLFLNESFSRQAFCSKPHGQVYCSLDCHKVITISLAKMMHLGCGLAVQQRISSQINKRQSQRNSVPGLQRMLSFQGGPKMRPTELKRQLNRCTKLQIRGDIKQLTLLKGTMCHHLTVTCILSSTEEGDARPCSWLSACQEDYKNAML